VRGRFRAIAAYCHAAPAPNVALRAIVEYERAGLALAAPHKPKVYVANKIADSLRHRHQQLLRRFPQSLFPPIERLVSAAFVTRRGVGSVDSPIDRVLRNQSVERLKIRQDRRGQRLSSIPLHEASEPFTQAARLLGDSVQGPQTVVLCTKQLRDFGLDRASGSEPV
jgi:hypothetical protein